VLGEQVLEDDYFEVHDGDVLMRITAVRIEGADVKVTLGYGKAGQWQTLLRARARVHVWREP